MTTVTQTRVLYENPRDEVRMVELSANYDGLPGCYHILDRKLAIFEHGTLVVQWHGGMNAPVELRLTFAELDTLIAHFNAYCETYGQLVPDTDAFGENDDRCTCPECGSQDTLSPSSHLAPLPFIRPVRSSEPAHTAASGFESAPYTQRCTGSCWICDKPCAHQENHQEYCYCTEHKRS